MENSDTAAPAATARWRPVDAVLIVLVTVAGALPRALRLGATEGFAWDESYYVPAGQDYRTGDFTKNFEHPPLAKWVIAAGIEVVGDDPIGWRLGAVVAGIVTVPLTYLLVRHLLHSPYWAAFASSLVAVDGMAIVQSRTAILDSLLPPLVVGAAVLIAVAFMAVPALVYVASYAGHFAAGLGPGEWVSLQRDMVDYHREFRVDHPRDSSPFTWLLLQRPVSYGSLHAPGRISITMALGNPALWWGFLASLPFLLATWWRRRDRTVELVLLAWASLHLSWLVAFVVFLPIWTYQDISVERFDSLMLFDGWVP